MSEWAVGLYAGEDGAFIGELGGSICWVDGLTPSQADVIVAKHNQEQVTVEDLEPVTVGPWDGLFVGQYFLHRLNANGSVTVLDSLAEPLSVTFSLGDALYGYAGQGGLG